MHAVPDSRCSSGRCVAAARPLLGLIRMNTYRSVHPHNTRTNIRVQKERRILSSKLSCLPVTHIFLHSLTIVMMNSGLSCAGRKIESKKREENRKRREIQIQRGIFSLTSDGKTNTGTLQSHMCNL